MLKKACILVMVMMCVIGIAECAWGGVSLSAFPNPAFREWLKVKDCGVWEWDPNSNGNGYFVGKDDGILSDKEVEYITSINFGGDIGIKSLKGIEHLTALRELRCSYNHLTELDLSHNTALTLGGLPSKKKWP